MHAAIAKDYAKPWKPECLPINLFRYIRIFESDISV
jgi:hypothetical protein